MKKFFILFFMFGFFFVMQSDVQAQRRSSSRTKTSTFRFTDDMVNKINSACPKVLKNASMRAERLEAFCSVKDIKIGEADLGPWYSGVKAFEKLFMQFRRVIYMAAAFMLLWIFVKAAYEGEMKWMHLSMLVIGVILLAFAEVIIDIAANRITLEDVLEQGVYVDCRKKQTKDAFYKCNVGENGAELYDVRYFLQLTGEEESTGIAPNKYKGLF